MLTKLPSTAYCCIVPRKKQPTSYSTPYHALGHKPNNTDQSETENTTPFFGAWPEIENPYQPLCFPTFLRAIYQTPDYNFLDNEKALLSAIEYLTQHLPTLDTEIIERLARTIIFNSKEQSKQGLHPNIDEIIQQTAMHVRLPYSYGSVHLFSEAHENAHWTAWSSYNSVIITNQVKRVQAIIDEIATMPELTTKEITELWNKFNQENTQLVQLVKKFEAAEEIYATYVAYRWSSPSVKQDVKNEIEHALREKGWYDAYLEFANACDIYHGFDKHPTDTATYYLLVRHGM
jgi:hypothetical protein